MDPTFRRSVLVFLQQLDAAHRPAVDADDVPTGLCTCGDHMLEGRDRHLLDEIAEGFAETGGVPHVVNVPLESETVVIRTYDPERVDEDRRARPDGHTDVDGDGDPDPYWEFKETVRINVPTDCPDCTRGLVSRGVDQICMTLPSQLDLGGEAGDVVACGVTRG